VPAIAQGTERRDQFVVSRCVLGPRIGGISRAIARRNLATKAGVVA
jgi:hypothetical protein